MLVFGRLGKRVKNILGRDFDLEGLTQARRQERQGLTIEDEELYCLLRPATAALEKARTEAGRGEMGAAAQALSEHFCERVRPVVFAHQAHGAALVPQFRENRHLWKALLVAAERAMSHEFTPLEGEPFSFGTSIDWFSDFQGRSWIFGHVADLQDRLKRESLDGMGPVERTWDFNRHGHFVDLARAYWLSRQESLVGEFLVQAADWAERNPCMGGINWLCPTTNAARAVNWLVSFHFMLGSPQLRGEPTVRLLRQLILHGAILNDCLLIRRKKGRLAMASALTMLALSFPELTCARRWLEVGTAFLLDTIDRDFEDGGFHRSGSSARHREAVEWLLLPLALYRLNRCSPPPGLAEAAHQAVSVMALCTPAHGQPPELGATWANQFLGRGVTSVGHTRRLMALGALVCERADLPLPTEFPVELLWWLGPEAQQRWTQLQATPGQTLSGAYSQAGIAVVRNHWEGNASWALLRGRPRALEPDLMAPAPASLPTHDDFLSLNLSLEGEPVLLEPGAPVAPGSVRMAFSRVAAHSSPRVAREREPLTLGRSGEEGATLRKVPEGTYLGASRPVWLMPDRPWELTREVLFMPGRKHIAIRDQLDGEGELHFESSLLLSSHLDVLMRGDMGCLLRGKQLQARIVPIFPTRFRYDLVRGCANPFGGWVWSGKPQGVHRLRYFTRIEAPFTVYLWLAWNPNDTKVPRVEELDRLFAQARRAPVPVGAR
ncbi:MAG: heparinase II/III family protein [Vulcanimicrobiota bacterium]